MYITLTNDETLRISFPIPLVSRPSPVFIQSNPCVPWDQRSLKEKSARGKWKPGMTNGFSSLTSPPLRSPRSEIWDWIVFPFCRLNCEPFSTEGCRVPVFEEELAPFSCVGAPASGVNCLLEMKGIFPVSAPYSSESFSDASFSSA